MEKKRASILKSLESFEFDETLKTSEELISKRMKSQESTFRTGYKVLNFLMKITRKDHLIASYNLFIKWFEFCLEFDQKLLSINNLMYFGIAYTKNLIAEKLSDLGLAMLDHLQEIYPFLSESGFDEDTEKYIKYLAQMAYNYSIQKELVSSEPDVALNYFIHGIKFYMKVESNLFMIIDSVRPYENSFFKTNRNELMYKNIFNFINESLSKPEENDEEEEDEKEEDEDNSSSSSLTQVTSRLKQRLKISDAKHKTMRDVYLIKVYQLLFLHNMCVNNLQKDKEKFNEELQKLPSYFGANDDSLLLNLKKTSVEYKDLKMSENSFTLINLIVRYTAQFQKEIKESAKPVENTNKRVKSSNSSLSAILAENFKIETQLKIMLNELFNFASANESYFQILILHYVFEILILNNSANLNDATVCCKFYQESFFDLLVTAASLFSKTVRRMYALHYHPEKMSKMFVINCLTVFIMCQKSIDQLLELAVEKKEDGEAAPVKWIDTEKGLDAFEGLIREHNEYMKWVKEKKLLGDQDLAKHYTSFENRIFRICSKFYSDEIEKYIRFQKLSMEIAMDRILFLNGVDKENLNDPNNLKNFRSICENTLLTYRVKEKFDESMLVLKQVFNFLSKLGIEQAEIEWLVTNWCKIKRDLWKTKSSAYQKVTIVDYMNIRKDLAENYLLEEVRIYNYFKSLENWVMMNDEIFNILEKLEASKTENMLIKCRIFIEIAQLAWTNQKDKNNKFNLSSEEYICKAEKFHRSHKCVTKLKHSAPTPNSPEDVIMLDDDKENEDCIMIISPVIEPIRKTRSKTCNKPSMPKSPPHATPSFSPNKPSSVNTCQCSASRIVLFQIELFKMLSEYVKCRSKMNSLMSNLMQSRMKKDTDVTTNADNLSLQSISSSSLICPELCDENGLKMDDAKIVKKLDTCLNILESMADSKEFKENFYKEEKSLKKQFFDSVDLLGHFYAFFGLILNRIKVFNFKLNILNSEAEKANGHDLVGGVYTSTVFNLMRAYLNASMCDEFLQLNNTLITTCLVEENAKNTENKLNKKDTSLNAATTKNTICLKDVKSLVEKNRLLSSKPETLIYYYLLLAHYFILKHKRDDAMSIIKSDVLTSSIINGKLTAFYYEIKFYLKYLQFLLVMSIVGPKSESQLQKIVENETPLSLLEDSCNAAFSVARYYLQNSFEPSRVYNPLALNANDKNADNENVYFNIAISDNYRVLADTLDIIQEISKFYLEISRYRDAIGYIREGLDIAQLNFSNRRTSLFLLHHVNADLIACCLTDATFRIKISEHLIGFDEENLHTLGSYTDLMKLRNFLYLHNLKITNEIKQFEQNPQQTDADSIIKKVVSLYNTISKCKLCYDYLIDLLINSYFIVSYSLRKTKKIKELTPLAKTLKEILLKSKEQVPCVFYEKWRVAELFCLAFELEPGASCLNNAYSLIKTNPYPALYRRICFNLFRNEADLRLKIEYLLETQSIALRHKACSIQIKQKRKSNIDFSLYEKITGYLTFGGGSGGGLLSKIEKSLPSEYVVVALVLVEASELYLVRIEAGNEPVLFKARFSQKYIDDFKTIISQNDRSMKQNDRTKFWTSRTLINVTLAEFVEDLEKNVLAHGKSLMLGTLRNVNFAKFTDRIKAELKTSSLSKSQIAQLRLVINGLEFLSQREMQNALKLEFSHANIEIIVKYLNEHKAKLSGLPRKHVCLLVDKYLHQIPWESLPSARNQSISRMPSIHFLLSHLKTSASSINKDNTFYIVDPGGDLDHTHKKFKPFFEQKKNWKGLIGVAPDEAQFKKALTEHELFIYTGHGSGSQYYPSDDVQKLRVQACSILMGCSSGNQYVMGEFEPYGTVLAYILAGCPCVVGNLWDVTDRDIDRLTEEFLESWIKEREDSDEQSQTDMNQAICAHLNKARNACKMTFLNGSAPIVYGLPVNFK